MAIDPKLAACIASLQERFGCRQEEFRGEITLYLTPEMIISALTALRDEFGFEFLVDVTAVDYWLNQEPRFQVVYHLRSIAQGWIICLRVPVTTVPPALPTAEKVYPSANWYEREVWDLFGIRFEGHSDLRRIVLPYDWAGHPLRKDYPLGYEEVQFTFNQEEIMVHKPHPKS
ncbi:MAG TPA: NADH-quinone oxidoreductase subunit C [Anaerolineaceae bacterium]